MNTLKETLPYIHIKRFWSARHELSRSQFCFIAFACNLLRHLGAQIGS